jgi:hypothetical protein
MNRGKYNELNNYPEWVSALIRELEGRAFTSGIQATNKRGGFEAINYAVYGVAVVEKQPLAILQLRRAYRRREGYFTSVRKDYYLIGRNESGTSFAHPVENTCVRGKALDTGEGPVLKALSLIWNVAQEDIPKIKRNGDVALIPTSFRAITSEAKEIAEATLADSHRLIPYRKGKLFQLGERYFVKGGAALVHTKGQHPRALVDSGTWEVIVGARAQHWGFTHPTAD